MEDFILFEVTIWSWHFLFSGPVKHLSYEELKICILKCDTEVLTENLLQALIQYIPPPDELNKLKEFEKEYDNLPEAEQFSISISGRATNSIFFAIRFW